MLRKYRKIGYFRVFLGENCKNCNFKHNEKYRTFFYNIGNIGPIFQNIGGNIGNIGIIGIIGNIGELGTLVYTSRPRFGMILEHLAIFLGDKAR